MIIAGGSRHPGEPTELVIFTDPYYVKLLLDYRNPEGIMPEERADFLRLIALFDEKELKCVCWKCKQPASMLAFYKGTLFHESWCSECTPFWLKEEDLKMDIFCDYISALEYVDDYCNADKSYYRMIIRDIAKQKGLPDGFGEKEAVEFFGFAEVQSSKFKVQGSRRGGFEVSAAADQKSKMKAEHASGGTH